MMTVYFITALLVALSVTVVPGRRLRRVVCMAFCAVQAALAVWVATGGMGSGSWMFCFDALGTLVFCLMALVTPAVMLAGFAYLDREDDRAWTYYHLWLMLLCVAVSGLYFADNVVVTWVFAEATTLCTAGLVYHRRTPRSLEATWKYLFVCSTGIAVAYLGILLLSTAATDGSLSYAAMAQAVSGGNPLYMKLAFLFILVGYSCKAEFFPLYTVGVDANSSAPAPASAFISTALVSGGFVALYRAMKLFAGSEIYPWICNVMVVAGVCSMLLGVLFMRRTNNYKRLLAYSTVENMGVVLIGLGVGGVGVFAALLHLTAHTLIKSAAFLQMARVGKTYGTYRINRIGGYMLSDQTGAATMLIITLLLAAFPPSPLFISEMMILGAAAAAGKWWLVAVMALLVCVVIYNLLLRVLRMCYKPTAAVATPPAGGFYKWLPVALVVVAAVLGLWQWNALVELINTIVL